MLDFLSMELESCYSIAERAYFREEVGGGQEEGGAGDWGWGEFEQEGWVIDEGKS